MQKEYSNNYKNQPFNYIPSFAIITVRYSTVNDFQFQLALD